MTIDLTELLHPSVRDGSVSRYRPKMTKEERCSALGLLTLGYTPVDVASVFGIHVRTASQLSRKSSANYRAVRSERESLGADAFIATYVSKELIGKANLAVSTRLRASAEQNTSALPVDDDAPNPRSKGREGTFMLMGRKIAIRWLNEADDCTSPGWYYLDEADPDMNYFGPFKHSKAAYDQAVIDMEAML